MIGTGGFLGIIFVVIASMLVFYKYSVRTSKLFYISAIFFILGYFISSFFLRFETFGYLDNIAFSYRDLSEVYLISGVYFFIAVSAYLILDFRSKKISYDFQSDRTIRLFSILHLPIIIILYWGIYTGQINSIRMFLGDDTKVTFIVIVATSLWPVTLLAYLTIIKKYSALIIFAQIGVSIAAGNRREIITIIMILLIVNYIFQEKRVRVATLILPFFIVVFLGVYSTAVQEELVQAIYSDTVFSLRSVLLPAFEAVYNNFTGQFVKMVMAIFAWQEQTYLIDASLQVSAKTGCSGITELPKLLLPFSNTFGFSGSCSNEKILFNHALTLANGDPYLIVPFIPDVIIGHGVEWLPLLTLINVIIYKMTEFGCLKFTRKPLVSFIYFAYFWPLTQSINQSFLNQTYVVFIKVMIFVLVLSFFVNLITLLLPKKFYVHRRCL